MLLFRSDDVCTSLDNIFGTFIEWTYVYNVNYCTNKNTFAKAITRALSKIQNRLKNKKNC